MLKILLVDDESRMLDLLALYLTPKGFECIKKTSGMEAVHYLEKNQADLILLDVMMPEMDGWETCNKIREFSSIPIIMVTARDQKTDIVKGLNIGADDYVTKPLDENELVARMEAVLRRTQSQAVIEYKGLTWNEENWELKYLNKEITVTPKEFSLLGMFLNGKNRVFSREQLILALWGYDSNTEDRTVDSHIRNLREKLRQSQFPIDDHLQTVWGIGYKWID